MRRARAVDGWEDVPRGDARPGGLGARAKTVGQQADGGDEGARGVAREQDDGAAGAHDAAPLAEGGPGPLEVLHDEVRVHEVEGGVLEWQRLAEVGGHEAVERLVAGAGVPVEVDPDELGDP